MEMIFSTVAPPNRNQISEYEKEVEAYNKLNDGYTYYLNMNPSGNFICFRMKNKTKFQKLSDRFWKWFYNN